MATTATFVIVVFASVLVLSPARFVGDRSDRRPGAQGSEHDSPSLTNPVTRNTGEISTEFVDGSEPKVMDSKSRSYYYPYPSYAYRKPLDASEPMVMDSKSRSYYYPYPSYAYRKPVDASESEVMDSKSRSYYYPYPSYAKREAVEKNTHDTTESIMHQKSKAKVYSA